MQHLIRTILLLSIAVLPVGVLAQERSPVPDIPWVKYHDDESPELPSFRILFASGGPGAWHRTALHQPRRPGYVVDL